MATFEIEANGKRYQVEAPSREAALAALGSMPKPSISRAEFSDRFNPPPTKGTGPQGNALDTAVQGLSLGFSDELLGGIAGLAALARTGNIGTAGKVAGAFTDEQRQRLADYRARDPLGATASELGGGLLTAALPGGAVAKGLQGGARVLGAMKAGGLAGAGYGALAGAGYADGGLADRGVGAAMGAGIGGGMGAALPLAGAGLGAIAKPIRDVVSARVNPSGYAARKVLERMSVPPAQAANRLARTPGMALMDVGGEGTRNLARTITNVPGPAAQRLTTQGNLRAMAQGDRIKREVGYVFADPDSYQNLKESIIQARRTRAQPYYDRAFAQPVPFTHDLEGLLQTPAGKAALAKAKVNSQNSREPWAQWFLNIGDDGSILDARRVPDMRALDTVKRELDDMIEAAKRPADGSPFAKAMATPASRAISSVRDELLRIVDGANPAYAEARKVAGETIGWDQALETGRNALTMDSRVLTKELGGMTADQREMARVGVAEAIRKKIDDAGFTHNALLKIFSTREQVARLRPFFRTAEDWRTFRKAMFAEARKRRSFDVLRGNSTTARQLADMADAGTLNDTVHTGGTIARSGLTAGLIDGVVRGLRRLGGLTPQTADEMAKLLATRDPQKVRDIASMLAALEARQGASQETRSAIRQALTRALAIREGAAVGSLQASAP